MNLQEFINYKICCPLCDSKLSHGFISKSREFFVEEDRFCVTINLRSIKRGQKTYFAKFIVENTNEFYVEFFNSKLEPFIDNVPIFVAKRFIDFIENISPSKIYGYCSTCENYSYHSEYFNLDFNNHTLTNLELYCESFRLKLTNILSCDMINYYRDKRSDLCFFKHVKEKLAYDTSNNLTIPIINFTSKKQICDRINKLLVFS